VQHNVLASRKISTNEIVTALCNHACDEDHIQGNEAHIQAGGDIQLIQEEIHPPHDGSQHGK
jgi:hypothetical protein